MSNFSSEPVVMIQSTVIRAPSSVQKNGAKLHLEMGFASPLEK